MALNQLPIIGATGSVIRFCEISPLWQKFGTIFQIYLIFDKVLNPLWHNLYALRQFCILENGQILKNNLTIWSHLLQANIFI